MKQDDNDRGSPVPETSSTMLRELAGGADSARWTEFVDLYTPVLVYWLNCLRQAQLPSLSPEMYDDIVQETLVSLMKLFPAGRYDRNRARFRTFLSSILRKRAVDCLRRSGYATLRFLPDEEMKCVLDAGAEAAERVERAERRELRAELWRLIVDRVFRESNYSGQTRAVFLRSVAGESAEALSREFGIERNAIYQIRNRIMKKLTEKARDLSRESGDILDMIDALEGEQGGKGDGSR